MNILGSMAGENLFPGFPFIRAFIDAFFRVQGDVLVVGCVNQQVEGGSPVFLVRPLLPVSGVAFAGIHALAVQRFMVRQSLKEVYTPWVEKT